MTYTGPNARTENLRRWNLRPAALALLVMRVYTNGALDLTGIKIQAVYSLGSTGSTSSANAARIFAATASASYQLDT